MTEDYDCEQRLREQGWLDPYEAETMAAMSHGQGMAEARADAAREAGERVGEIISDAATVIEEVRRDTQPDPRVEALRKALLRRAVHRNFCRSTTPDDPSCTCDLYAALATPAPPPAGIDFRCPRCGFMVDSPMHTESCARLAPQPTEATDDR